MGNRHSYTKASVITLGCRSRFDEKKNSFFPSGIVEGECGVNYGLLKGYVGKDDEIEPLCFNLAVLCFFTVFF